MSDWEFLHEMHDLGYSSKEIADAAASGAAPWEWVTIDLASLESVFADASFDDVCPIPQQRFRSRAGFPFDPNEQRHVLDTLVQCARRHFNNTGRYLQIWGELGELYAETKFGLCRHATNEKGSDGTIAGRRVEVKTISPAKRRQQIRVKSSGDFEQVLIVQIDHDFKFRGTLVNRETLTGGGGRFLKGRLGNSDGTG